MPRIVAGSLTAVILSLALVQASGSPQPPSQNGSSVGTDEFAATPPELKAGGACLSPEQGLPHAPCSTLQIYLRSGGRDPFCIQQLQTAIRWAKFKNDVDQKLENEGRGFGGSNQPLYQPWVESPDKIRLAMNSYFEHCGRKSDAVKPPTIDRPQTPRPLPGPLGQRDEFASGGNSGAATIPPDEIASNPPPTYWPWIPPPNWPPPPGWGWPSPPSPARVGTETTPTPQRGCQDPIIRSSQDLAKEVFLGYYTNPILIAGIRNQPGTYLVALSGLQVLSPQLVGSFPELLTAANGGVDSYADSVITNLADTIGAGPAKIILAGHSLGGMVVENLAARWTSPQTASFRRPVRSVTFGSPISKAIVLPASLTRRFAVVNDYVVLGAPIVQQAVIRRSTLVPVAPGSPLYTWVDNGGDMNTHMAYPLSHDLTTFDALGDRAGQSLVLDCRVWRRSAILPGPDQKTYPPAPPPSQRGMPVAEDRTLQQSAQLSKFIILVRDANPAATQWIGKLGYQPKPMWIKDKTIKAGECANSGLAGLSAFAPSATLSLSQASMQYAAAGILIGSAADCYVLYTPSPSGRTRYYSDTDLHGVYDTNGNDAWTPTLLTTLNQRFQTNALPQMIQHPPQDNWSDRNHKLLTIKNTTVQNGNYGPQPPVSAYLPDGSTVHLPDLCWMKRFYLEHNIPWTRIYPFPDEQPNIPNTDISGCVFFRAAN